MNRFFLPVALLVSTTACATIMDFQDPTDRATAASENADAHALETATSSSTSSSTSSTSGSSPTGDAESPVTKLTATECSCVPTAPTGWTGPFVVAESTGTEPPKCTVDYPREAYLGRTGSQASPAECSCSCGKPTDVTCSAPVASFFSDATCSTTACHVDPSAIECSSTAKNFTCDDGKKLAAVAFGPSVPSGGKCEPSATAVVPEVSWNKAIRLCAPETTTPSSCDGGVCQPTPSPVFAATNRCIMKSGEETCPPAYPVRQLFQAGGTDTRACGACACDAPAGVTCAASPSILGSTCKPAAGFAEPTGCVAVPSNVRIGTTAGTPEGGECNPKGGAPTGAFTVGVSTTVCCLE